MKESKPPLSKTPPHAEIGERWDNTDFGEHWDEANPAEFEVEAPILHPSTAAPIDVFFSYSHKDEALRDQLQNHLSGLKREGVIRGWHDRRITPGQEWNGLIDEHLNAAEIILLLVSADFLASDYCYAVEVQRAMERHMAGEARVIPIILRPCDWQQAPFGKVQVLPKDAKAVTSWSNSDEAFLDIAQGIRRLVQQLVSSLQPESESKTSLPRVNRFIPTPPIVEFVRRKDRNGEFIVERLIAELTQPNPRLAALSGEGGVGKTTIAAEVARRLIGRFQGRVVWASAEKRTDFSFSTLLDEIATQLRDPGPLKLTIGPKSEAVAALVAAAPALILLDNFETVSPADQAACEQFLDSAHTAALITSRLRVSSARNIYVDSMSQEEAREFLEKLMDLMQDPGVFSPAVRENIITAADARPYVMEWVVAQIDQGALRPGKVLEKLGRGEGDAAQRVFDRSLNLAQVGDDGRATMMALSLFVPSASREALAAVAGFNEDDVRLEAAARNLRSFLLVKGVDGNRRLTIEGLTRSLAKARMANDAKGNEYRIRFVQYFVNYVRDNAKPEDYDALELEKDNAISAMDLAFQLQDWDAVNAIAHILAAPVSGMLSVHGYWTEAIKAIQQALAAAQKSGNQKSIAVSMHNLAIIRANRGELQEARRLYNESLEIKEKLGNESGIAVTLHQLGNLAQAQGQLAEARRLYDESLDINKRVGNQSGIAVTLHQLAMLAQHQGKFGEARRLYDESLEIQKGLGNQAGIALTLHQLANLALSHGELKEARRLYDESLEIQKKLGNQSGIAISLHQLAILAQDQGRLAEARRLYDESVEIQKKLGNQSGIALTLHQLAMLAQEQGELAEARRLYDESLEIVKKLGDQSGIALTLHQLAMLAQDQGELTEARRLYVESLEIVKTLGDQSGIATTLGALGLLEGEAGNSEDALRLLREALGIFESLNSPDAEVVRREVTRIEDKSPKESS